MVGCDGLRDCLQKLHIVINLFFAQLEKRLETRVTQHAGEFDQYLAADEQRMPFSQKCKQQSTGGPVRMFIRPYQNIDVTQDSQRTDR